MNEIARIFCIIAGGKMQSLHSTDPPYTDSGTNDMHEAFTRAREIGVGASVYELLAVRQQVHLECGQCQLIPIWREVHALDS